MAQVSKEANKLIGRNFLIDVLKRGKPTLTSVIIEGVRTSPTEIHIGKKKYTGIQYKMRPTRKGAAAYWSETYPDQLIKK